MKEIDPEELSLLLVDDEPKIINGLERKLGMLEMGWDINVAYSGKEALQTLEVEPIDVIVSDLRMPEMNGALFLAHAKKRHPDTLRFILSGYADRDLMIRATSVAHRYLTKPCNSQELVNAIRQVFETQKLLANSDICTFVNETGELHADNKPLEELLEMTNDPESEIEDIAAFIESQPTVHASILHVANTAFFGAGGHIETLREALQVLGMEFVRSLAIMELSKAKLALPEFQMSMVDSILKHCVQTTLFAHEMKSLAEDAKLLQRLASISLLHDLGKIVFLVRRGDDYLKLWKESIERKLPLWKLEREHYGCDHAGLGAYLFDLWGLPEAVIRGVAWHHQPLKVVKDRFCCVSLLHMANYGAHQTHSQKPYFSGEIDPELAHRFSLSPKFYNELN